MVPRSPLKDTVEVPAEKVPALAKFPDTVRELVSALKVALDWMAKFPEEP